METSTTRKVNIAAIGVGAFMARQHLPNILRNPRIRLHTLCDVNADLLRQRASEYHPLRTTTNADEVFSDAEIDAVLVGTRGEEHARFVIKALAHGKHIYVEKPMTHTYGETREVLTAARGARTKVAIGFNRRFAPSMVEAKQRFQEYRSGPANIIYRIVDDHRVRPSYVFDLARGGGHLLAEGCHIFDLLAWFLDAEPVEVYAAGPLETDNIVTLSYSDGSLAAMACGGKGGLFYPKECMEVFCNNRTLAVDSFYELRLDGPGGNIRRTFPLAAKSRVQLDEESMSAFYDATFRSRPPHDVVGEHAGNDIPTPVVDKGHAQAIAAFAAAVAGEGPFPMSVEDGARATICALRAYDSIRERRPVPISPLDYRVPEETEAPR